MKSRLFFILVSAAAFVGPIPQPIRAADESYYAPGWIREHRDGWTAKLPSTTRFLSRWKAQNAPEEVAPFAALFDGRPYKTAMGYDISTLQGNIRITRRMDGFVIETPQERFEAIRRFPNEWELRPYPQTIRPKPSVQPPNRRR
ncbi:MAG: hypothetical protein NZ740_02535 [Kiritimatiellae bacterium]|nr:hypothetical protein [Kiritimatiellia bacterium]MDW8457969.1 hypothetical protein [Verrucomicrobiota bacterium]